MALNHRRLITESFLIHQAVIAIRVFEETGESEELLESMRQQEPVLSFVRRVREALR